MSNAVEKVPGILNREMTQKVNGILDAYQCSSNRLVNILLEVQDIIPKQYIPREMADYISEKMNIPLSKIYDVISFYAALSDVPRADYVIQLCDSVVCKVTGNTTLREAVTEHLNIKPQQSTADGKYWLEYTPCFGACDIGPAMRINGRVHGHLTSKEKIREILDRYQ